MSKANQVHIAVIGKDHISLPVSSYNSTFYLPQRELQGNTASHFLLVTIFLLSIKYAYNRTDNYFLYLKVSIRLKRTGQNASLNAIPS